MVAHWSCNFATQRWNPEVQGSIPGRGAKHFSLLSVLQTNQMSQPEYNAAAAATHPALSFREMTSWSGAAHGHWYNSWMEPRRKGIYGHPAGLQTKGCHRAPRGSRRRRRRDPRGARWHPEVWRPKGWPYIPELRGFIHELSLLIKSGLSQTP